VYNGHLLNISGHGERSFAPAGGKVEFAVPRPATAYRLHCRGSAGEDVLVRRAGSRYDRAV